MTVAGHLKQLRQPVDIYPVTQPSRAQPADFLVTAVHNASRAALTMAVVVVALIGADAAVAVSRTAGSASDRTPTSASVPSGPMTTPSPGGAATPATSSSPRAHAASARSQSAEARQLLGQAFSNALEQGSVHAVAHTVSKKIGTAVFDDYDAKNGGVQHISIYGGHIEVRVIGRTTYFTGDRLGLTRYMGFTDDEVSVLGKKWLSLTSRQAGYTAVTEGVTLASAMDEDRIVAPLELLPERAINGVTAVGVRGRATGDGAPKHAIATMWISTGETPLPVRFVAHNQTIHLTQDFSDWGVAVPLRTPANVFGAKTLQG